jgi:hypothetical protein
MQYNLACYFRLRTASNAAMPDKPQIAKVDGSGTGVVV